MAGVEKGQAAGIDAPRARAEFATLLSSHSSSAGMEGLVPAVLGPRDPMATRDAVGRIMVPEAIQLVTREDALRAAEIIAPDGAYDETKAYGMLISAPAEWIGDLTTVARLAHALGEDPVAMATSHLLSRIDDEADSTVYEQILAKFRSDEVQAEMESFALERELFGGQGDELDEEGREGDREVAGRGISPDRFVFGGPEDGDEDDLFGDEDPDIEVHRRGKGRGGFGLVAETGPVARRDGGRVVVPGIDEGLVYATAKDAERARRLMYNGLDHYMPYVGNWNETVIRELLALAPEEWREEMERQPDPLGEIGVFLRRLGAADPSEYPELLKRLQGLVVETGPIARRDAAGSRIVPQEGLVYVTQQQADDAFSRIFPDAGIGRNVGSIDVQAARALFATAPDDLQEMLREAETNSDIAFAALMYIAWLRNH